MPALNDADGVYVGAQQIDNAYVGTLLVYQRALSVSMIYTDAYPVPQNQFWPTDIGPGDCHMLVSGYAQANGVDLRTIDDVPLRIVTPTGAVIHDWSDGWSYNASESVSRTPKISKAALWPGGDNAYRGNAYIWEWAPR